MRIREVHINILIADDSSAMRRIVKKTLRSAGFAGHDVQEANDGAAALERIREEAPDLILCDWNMPNMSGLELLETLQAEGQDIPFGFVTTEGSPQMRAKATEAGAKFLITKPFTAETFSKVLAPYIKD